MTGHARLSASQTKWWANCPGALAYLEAHPELWEDSSGYHAQMGTAAHALVERCLGEGSEPSDYGGRLIEIVETKDGGEDAIILKEGNTKWSKQATSIVFEVDVEMYEAVECMTTYVRNRVFELGLTSDPAELALQTVDLIKNGIVRLEARVVPLPECDDTGGTADVIIDAWPVALEVIDYKNGSGVFVPVTGNEQLRSYALGALLEAGVDDYLHVRYTICQPRHMNSPSDGVMSEDTTPAELLDWKRWLASAAEMVDIARAKVAKGATLDDLYIGNWLSVRRDGSHCTFCALKHRCPAVLAKAQELAMVDFDDDPDDIEVLASTNHLAMMLPWVPFLDKWLKAIAGKAEELMFAGGHIEGQKVVRKRSTGRKWIERRPIASEEEGSEPTYEDVTKGDIIAALVEYGANEADLYTEPTEPRLLSGPKAEKFIPKKRRRELTDRFMYTPEGGLTIAPEDDKREAVVIDPASDFDDVTD